MDGEDLKKNPWEILSVLPGILIQRYLTKKCQSHTQRRTPPDRDEMKTRISKSKVYLPKIPCFYNTVWRNSDVIPESCNWKTPRTAVDKEQSYSVA
jgi:type II secretory ATPase GspE/PulE/Tfp pilus assembly ATPase PilB-like protein